MVTVMFSYRLLIFSIPSVSRSDICRFPIVGYIPDSFSISINSVYNSLHDYNCVYS